MIKPGVELTPFISDISDFLNKQSADKSFRVSFKYNPLDLQDKEILYLCSFFGKPITSRVD